MSLAYFEYDSFCIARSKGFLAISLKSDPKAFIALAFPELDTAENHHQDLESIYLITTGIVLDKIVS